MTILSWMGMPFLCVQYVIADTHQQQARQMHGWLSVWELPSVSIQPVVAWMDEDGGHGGLHGFAPAASRKVAAMLGISSAARQTRGG